MLWIKAFHIIFMVAWFSGLFYLPRLFVYHAGATDSVSNERFKVMEKKLFYYIMTPGAVLTMALGMLLLSYNWSGYLQAFWMDAKLILVALLVIYHIYLGKLLCAFQRDQNKHSSVFYRWLNEVPTIFLIAIVLLVILKP